MAEAKITALEKKVERGVAKPKARVDVAPEQLRYANLLLYGTWLGIAVLAVTFALYAGGIMPSYVDPSQIQNYWGMKASDYLAAANVPHGWGWLTMIKYGDFFSLIGIVLLGGLTVVGYLILLPAYLAKKDYIYSSIVVVEVLVLVLAASGILKAGH
jgi:hypothetical protein